MEAAQRQLVEVHGETPEAAAAAARPPLVTEGTTALQLLMADAARKLEQAGGGTWRASPGGTWRQDTAAMVEPGAALELEVFVVQGRLKGQPPPSRLPPGHGRRLWRRAKMLFLMMVWRRRAAALAIHGGARAALARRRDAAAAEAEAARTAAARAADVAVSKAAAARAAIVEADAAEAAAVKVVSRTPAPGAVVRQESRSMATLRHKTALRRQAVARPRRWLDETRARRLMQELDQTTGWRRLAPRLRYVGRLRIGLRRWLDEVRLRHILARSERRKRLWRRAKMLFLMMAWRRRAAATTFQKHRRGRVARREVANRRESVRVQHGLIEQLIANKGKVSDLFRRWDTDNDGLVSRAEFDRAMSELRIETKPGEVDALWQRFDRDGSGAVDFKEVQKELFRAQRPRSSRRRRRRRPSPRPPQRNGRRRRRRCRRGGGGGGAGGGGGSAAAIEQLGARRARSEEERVALDKNATKIQACARGLTARSAGVPRPGETREMHGSWRRTCTALRPSRCRLVLWNRGTLAALQPHFGPLASLLASCGGGGPFTPLDSASLGRKGWDRALTLLKIPTPLTAELDAAVFAAADDVSLTFGVGAAGRTAVELPFLLQAAVWASLPDGSRPPARWLRWQPRPLGGGGDDLDVTGSELAARVGADADGAALLGAPPQRCGGKHTSGFSRARRRRRHRTTPLPGRRWRSVCAHVGRCGAAQLLGRRVPPPIFNHYAHGGKVAT